MLGEELTALELWPERREDRREHIKNTIQYVHSFH